MQSKKRKKLESAGWHVGDAAELLGLDDVESRLLDIKSVKPLVRSVIAAGAKPRDLAKAVAGKRK